MQNFSVIMAGGGGTRFWPLSRQNMPKQLLKLSGNDAMINETIKRCSNLIPVQNTYIVTNKVQAEVMNNILVDRLPRENILVEPCARNTAPCILYAAWHIFERFGDGVMCVFPADHYITDELKFKEILDKAIKCAKDKDAVITLGVKPTFSSTGYGYVKRGENTDIQDIYTLDKFVEKPNISRAKEYISTGDYFWNSGIFIWKISVILNLFERFLPRMYSMFKKARERFTLEDEKQMIAEIYPLLDNISVDYGLMERLDNALMIPGDFGWNDVGSWDTLGAIFPADKDGNIIKADFLGIETKSCIIYGDKKLITTIGIESTVIVDTEDAILICAKDKAQEVKSIIDKLKETGRNNLL